uniref:Calponin-homology (CH) domain-containing protein n=1 Tax=Nothoprocta perdicaria TaxID=30464 RepID=A0A8C6Z289_NOTPE
WPVLDPLRLSPMGFVCPHGKGPGGTPGRPGPSRGLMPSLHADERDAVQKKTFTKWVNSHLARASCRVSDLYADLRDGYVLTRLLEVLSGEQLVSGGGGGRNVDKALQFLKEQRVHLENVGSHDIVDGNHRLTLGLIWTIILRFQVAAASPVPAGPAAAGRPCGSALVPRPSPQIQGGYGACDHLGPVSSFHRCCCSPRI